VTNADVVIRVDLERPNVLPMPDPESIPP
jgi:hypothetical protein